MNLGVGKLKFPHGGSCVQGFFGFQHGFQLSGEHRPFRRFGLFDAILQPPNCPFQNFQVGENEITQHCFQVSSGVYFAKGMNHGRVIEGPYHQQEGIGGLEQVPLLPADALGLAH